MSDEVDPLEEVVEQLREEKKKARGGYFRDLAKRGTSVERSTLVVDGLPQQRTWTREVVGLAGVFAVDTGRQQVYMRMVAVADDIEWWVTEDLDDGTEPMSRHQTKAKARQAAETFLAAMAVARALR